MVPGGEPRDAGSALDHFAPPFMAQHTWKRTLGVVAGQREGVGVTDPGGDGAQQHLPGFGTFDIDLLDGKRLLWPPGDGGTGFHRRGPRVGGDDGQACCGAW